MSMGNIETGRLLEPVNKALTESGIPRLSDEWIAIWNRSYEAVDRLVTKIKEAGLRVD